MNVTAAISGRAGRPSKGRLTTSAEATVVSVPSLPIKKAKDQTKGSSQIAKVVHT